LAATAEAVPGVTITVTRRWTRSVTSDDNRSYWPFRSAVFDRYILALDIAYFVRLCRKTITRPGMLSVSSDPVLRYPITGIGC
jgi:hypothetical protein